MLPMVFFVDRISMVAFGRVQCPTFGQLDQLALNVLPLPSHSDVIIILWITFSSQRKHTILYYFYEDRNDDDDDDAQAQQQQLQHEKQV